MSSTFLRPRPDPISQLTANRFNDDSDGATMDSMPDQPETIGAPLVRRRSWELWILKQQISGCPHSIDLDNALFGERRARFYELLNEERMIDGLASLVNDEVAYPDLATGRRQTFALALLANNRAVGIWGEAHSLVDAEVEIECLEKQVRAARNKYFWKK